MTTTATFPIEASSWLEGVEPSSELSDVKEDAFQPGGSTLDTGTPIEFNSTELETPQQFETLQFLPFNAPTWTANFDAPVACDPTNPTVQELNNTEIRARYNEDRLLKGFVMKPLDPKEDSDRYIAVLESKLKKLQSKTDIDSVLQTLVENTDDVYAPQVYDPKDSLIQAFNEMSVEEEEEEEEDNRGEKNNEQDYENPINSIKPQEGSGNDDDEETDDDDENENDGNQYWHSLN